MNERIKLLAREAGLEFDDDLVLEPEPIYYTTQKDLEKFAELIVRECTRLNLELSYELAGVIVDTEEGIGFDSVCLNTVKQVHKSLANNQLIEHFGLEQNVNKTLRNRSTYFGNDI
jgi:hypothetical protein